MTIDRQRDVVHNVLPLGTAAATTVISPGLDGCHRLGGRTQLHVNLETYG